MPKIENLIVIKQEVTFPIEEMKAQSVTVEIIFDCRGQNLANGKSEEAITRLIESSVYGLVSDVMAEYIATSFGLIVFGSEMGKPLEKTLADHLKVLRKTAKCALEKEIEKAAEAASQ